MTNNTNTATKFCIDCEHCATPEATVPDQKISFFYCTRPNLVTGAPGKVGWVECKMERGRWELCGPEGKFWSKKVVVVSGGKGK